MLCSIWDRTPNPTSLLNTSICPTPVGITVTRDPMSGELLGYKEVYIYMYIHSYVP